MVWLGLGTLGLGLGKDHVLIMIIQTETTVSEAKYCILNSAVLSAIGY